MAPRRRSSEAPRSAAAQGRPGGRSQQNAHVCAWKARFRAVYGHTTKIAVACQLAGISRRTSYDTRKKDPAFALAADHARADAIDRLLEEMTLRARSGSLAMALAILAHSDPSWDPDWPGPTTAPASPPSAFRLGLAPPLPEADQARVPEPLPASPPIVFRLELTPPLPGADQVRVPGTARARPPADGGAP